MTYPDKVLLNIKKDNGTMWQNGDKIAVIFDKPIIYRYQNKYKGGFYFVSEEKFMKTLMNSRLNGRKRYADKDVINFRNEINLLKLESKCCKCGYNKNPEVLCFDHLNPNDKISSITKMIQKFVFAAKSKREIIKKLVKEEIAKCQILCFNCHAEKTSINQCGINKAIKTYTTIEDYVKENQINDILFRSVPYSTEYIIPTNYYKSTNPKESLLIKTIKTKLDSDLMAHQANSSFATRNYKTPPTSSLNASDKQH